MLGKKVMIVLSIVAIFFQSLSLSLLWYEYGNICQRFLRNYFNTVLNTLICAFVFAYAKRKLSHDAAQIPS